MALTITTGIDNFKPWSGAVSTWDTIIEEDKLDALEFILEDLYPDGITDTQLNDILWFESDWVYESLGITEEDEEEDEY